MAHPRLSGSVGEGPPGLGEQYAKPDYYQWAIVPKELEEPVGSIAVVGQDPRAGKAAVGYCIGRSWWH